MSIKEGLEAKARGDVDQATVLLGKAAKIAIQTGNDEVTPAPQEGCRCCRRG